MTTLTRTTSLATIAALTLAGCTSTPDADAPQGLIVTAAFYPLEYIATGVAGDAATVRTVAAPGVDAHDLELSPAAVRELRESDVVIYVDGFQPAVDAAVEQLEGVTLINVGDYLDFRQPQQHAEEEEGDHEDEEEDAHDDGDPHFWLDPALYAELAPVLAGVLAELDGPNADGYTSRAAELEADLIALDHEFSSGLSECERDVVVVSHEAFGYLTDAYDLHQVGLAGITPDAEPSPARIREVREIAEREGITTIYFETLVDSSVSETFASDLGLETAVLDPLEGLTDDEDDYRSVMERNLDALVAGLDCR